MGPDCGTGIIQSVPIAFTNNVAPGSIGIIGASGTGIQELTTIIDRLLFPSSHGVDGFIRIQSMGASLSEVLPEIRMLCILTLIYGGLACIGIHQVIGREQRERLAQRMNDKEEY